MKTEQVSIVLYGGLFVVRGVFSFSLDVEKQLEVLPGKVIGIRTGSYPKLVRTHADIWAGQPWRFVDEH